MRIDYQKIKNKLFGGKQDKAKISIKVYRDWKLLLSVFLTILFAVFIFGIYFLFNINNERQITVEIKSYIKTINRNEMKNILDKYSVKKDAFGNLLKKRARSIDPSL